MAVCLYCIDNDIIKKLATFQRFNRTIAILGASTENLFILETAKYKFENDWKKLQKGRVRTPEERLVNYQEVLRISRSLPCISAENVDQELFAELNSIKDIDEEALLTANLIKSIEAGHSALLLTGDKRFLRALANAPLPNIQDALQHKLWCFEQLILKNIQVDGFEAVKEAIVPVKGCDKAMATVFGSGEKSTRQNSLDTLKSYIDNLRANSGTLLHPYPADDSIYS